MRSKIIFNLLILVTFISFNSCRHNPVGPSQSQPGSRDYVWELDTLNMPMNYLGAVWGAVPNNVWAVGAGGTSEDRLQHYNGKKWSAYNDEGKNPINCLGNTIFGFSENNIWMGGGDELSSGAAIWHYDGNRWSRNYIYHVKGEYSTEVEDIWGLTPNNIYACGIISYPSISGNLFQSFVLHYNGGGWIEVAKSDTNYEFNFIRSEYTNSNSFLNLGYKTYIQAFKYSKVNSDSNIFAFYELDGKKLKKIYSNTEGKIFSATIHEIDNKVYFLISHSAYRYINGNFVKQFTLSIPNFGYQFWARSPEDIFVRMMDGIAHYNGTDIKYLYRFTTKMSEINEPLILKNDVFFVIWDESKSQIINEILHGKLK